MAHCPTCLKPISGVGPKRHGRCTKKRTPWGGARRRTYCGRKCREADRRYLRRRMAAASSLTAMDAWVIAGMAKGRARA